MREFCLNIILVYKDSLSLSEQKHQLHQACLNASALIFSFPNVTPPNLLFVGLDLPASQSWTSILCSWTHLNLSLFLIGGENAKSAAGSSVSELKEHRRYRDASSSSIQMVCASLLLLPNLSVVVWDCSCLIKLKGFDFCFLLIFVWA